MAPCDVHEIVMEIIDNPEIVIFVMGGFVGVVAVICGSLSSVAKTRAREQTRREIAAYIAEGSLSAEQGERLLVAEPDELKGQRS